MTTRVFSVYWRDAKKTPPEESHSLSHRNPESIKTSGQWKYKAIQGLIILDEVCTFSPSSGMPPAGEELNLHYDFNSMLSHTRNKCL